MEGHATDTRLAEARAVRGGGGPGAVRQALAAAEAALRRESGSNGVWGGGGAQPPLRNASPRSAAGGSPGPLLRHDTGEAAGPLTQEGWFAPLPPAATRAVEEALAEALDDVGWLVLQVRADGLTCGGIQVGDADLAAALTAIDVASVVLWDAGPAEAAAFVALVGLARGVTATGETAGATLSAWRTAHVAARVEATPPRLAPLAATHAPAARAEGELGAEARERLRVLRSRPSAYLGRVRPSALPEATPAAPRLDGLLARLIPEAPGLAARIGTTQVQPGDLGVLITLLDAVDTDPTLRETCVRAGAARRGLTARLDPEVHAAWCFTWWTLTLPEHLSEVGLLSTELGEVHAGIVHDALAARPAAVPAVPPPDVPGLVAYLELAARAHDLTACAEAARSLGHGDARVRIAALRAWAHARPADDARVSALATRDPDPRVRATARGVLSSPR